MEAGRTCGLARGGGGGAASVQMLMAMAYITAQPGCPNAAMEPCTLAIIVSVLRQKVFSGRGFCCDPDLDPADPAQALTLPFELQVIVAGISARINQQLRQRMINI